MKNTYSQINSANLTLKRLIVSDAVAVQKLLAENKKYMLPWIAWAKDEPQSVSDKKAQIRTWNGEFLLDQKYVYGLFPKGKHTLAGLCFLLTRQGDGILEIGYIVDYQYTGKGFATELSYALAKLSFEVLKVEKSLIVCSTENIASTKVPEKLGYQLESTYKELTKKTDGSREGIMRWAMYQEDFQLINRYEPVEFVQEEGW